jgi:hypothetical protein
MTRDTYVKNVLEKNNKKRGKGRRKRIIKNYVRVQ